MRFKPCSDVFEGDFFSLYPTIISAYNISFDTLVPFSQITKDNEHLVTKLNINYKSGIEEESKKFIYFWKPEVKRGIFPQLTDNLLLKRETCDPQSNTYK